VVLHFSRQRREHHASIGLRNERVQYLHDDDEE
jgi:hypothetical protein